jgi:hypothetical protein
MKTRVTPAPRSADHQRSAVGASPTKTSGPEARAISRIAADVGLAGTRKTCFKESSLLHETNAVPDSERRAATTASASTRAAWMIETEAPCSAASVVAPPSMTVARTPRPRSCWQCASSSAWFSPLPTRTTSPPGALHPGMSARSTTVACPIGIRDLDPASRTSTKSAVGVIPRLSIRHDAGTSRREAVSLAPSDGRGGRSASRSLTDAEHAASAALPSAKHSAADQARDITRDMARTPA